MIYKKSWKYILIEGNCLYRIKSLKDFKDVRKGDIGGFIQGYHNLSQSGNCWIYNNAQVFNRARVFGNAIVTDNAWVHGDAKVFENAKVSGKAHISYCTIFGNARIVDRVLTEGFYG